MTKGGARVPSDIFAVGKGMGLERHYEVLCLINSKIHINTKEAVLELNKKFAWWDDPDAQGPTETCRSYLKEMWRLGLLERVSLKKSCVIPISLATWNGGEQPPTYRVSKLGKFILSQNKNLFPYYTAWCIISAWKNKIYPQVDKLFKLFDFEGYIPVNDDVHVKLTEKQKIYVEKHAGKAIKFGWLEPTGIIFRISKDRFSLNKKFVSFLSGINYTDLFNDTNGSIIRKDTKIGIINKSLGITSFKKGLKYDFNLELENLSNKEISLVFNYNPFSLFFNNSRLIFPEKVKLVQNEKRKINFSLVSDAIDFSDSLMSSCIGSLEISCNGKRDTLFLPEIYLMHEDHIWELEICDLLTQLGLQVFHLTGKSDRPDAVIDLSGLTSRPVDLLEYLRDKKKEKIFMETTLGEYSGTKLVADTMKENKRGLTKYETHTQHVLKISSVGQLIASDTFSSNISDKFNTIKDKAGHIITLIDKENLLLLIKNYKKSRNKNTIIDILKSGQIISNKIIKEIFNE